MSTRLTIEIDEQTKQKAKAQAYHEGYTLKDKITKLLIEWLQSKEAK